MGQLFETIRRLVHSDDYLVREHASERLDERGIREWQAVAGLGEGLLIVERVDATPKTRG